MRKPAELRQREALERKFVRKTMSARDQVKSLDSRLGKGVGAKRERARLAPLVELEAQREKQHAEKKRPQQNKQKFKKGRRDGQKR